MSLKTIERVIILRLRYSITGYVWDFNIYTGQESQESKTRNDRPGIIQSTKTRPGMIQPTKARPGTTHSVKARPGMIQPVTAKLGMIQPVKARTQIICLARKRPSRG